MQFQKKMPIYDFFSMQYIPSTILPTFSLFSSAFVKSWLDWLQFLSWHLSNHLLVKYIYLDRFIQRKKNGAIHFKPSVFFSKITAISFKKRQICPQIGLLLRKISDQSISYLSVYIYPLRTGIASFLIFLLLSYLDTNLRGVHTAFLRGVLKCVSSIHKIGQKSPLGEVPSSFLSLFRPLADILCHCTLNFVYSKCLSTRAV